MSYYNRKEIKSPVNYEVKGQLAKLLATEDIIIENRKVPTASFDVQRRILTLPLWEKASEVVYDLLVGHEVGHALYTPEDNWKKDYPTVPMSFVNILEDVRIEKLMRRKYPGLIKTFRNGYSQLADQDFFEIEEVELDTLGLPDRINLHYKVGSFNEIPFTVAESIFVRRASETSSFQDVLDLAKDLTEYLSSEDDKKTRTQVNVNGDQESESEIEKQDVPFDSSESTDAEPEIEGESERPDLGEDKTEYEDENLPSNDMGDYGGDLDTVTDKTLQDNIDNLTDTSSEGDEPSYVEYPELDVKRLVASSEEVNEYLDGWFKLCEKTFQENKGSYITLKGPFQNVDEDYTKFKRNAQKEVNYLVKEFECRKSASAYARAATSRTGVLDTTKLNTYKFNEDLFKKVTTLPDGKNHGLIFVLDWSGSMSDVLLDTVKQLYNLIWFCKKVQIPFEVYAFTNEWNRHWDGIGEIPLKEHHEEKEFCMKIEKDFSMVNFLSSSTKNSQLEKQMLNIFRLATSMDHVGRQNYYGYPYQYPTRLSLSGTPLNEALVSLNSIIPDFKKRTKVEKIQCITLTDGDAHPLRYSAMVKTRYWEEDGGTYLGGRCCSNGKTFIRDRKTGKTYFCKSDYHQFTAAVLNQLRDRFPSTNFIGIRVLPPRDASHFIRRHCDYDFNKTQEMVNSWKKNRSFGIPNAGYHTYFGLASNSLSNDTEFEVKEDATKAQIKRAFGKSLKGKKMNKRVLGEFISLIA